MSAKTDSADAFLDVLSCEGEGVLIDAVAGLAIVSDPLEALSFQEEGSRNRVRKSLKVALTTYPDVLYKHTVTYNGESWKILQKAKGLISWSLLIDRVK